VIVAALVILVGTAVIIARGDVAQEVAGSAQELRLADAMSATTSVLGSATREAILAVGQASTPMPAAALAEATNGIRGARDAMLESVAALSALVPLDGLKGMADVAAGHATEVAESLDRGAVAEAARIADALLAPALDHLSVASETVGANRAGHIAALAESLGTVTTAARYVSALIIPALALLFGFRAMQRAQRLTLLRKDLARERELRRKKDAFVAAASHHINTPLSAVVGFAELLRDRTRDFNAGVRVEVTELLALQAQETAIVVDDLLVAAKHDLGEFELDDQTIDIRDLVDAATSDWVATQRMRLTVTGNAVASGDARWLTHAIRNVLRNASSFGGDDIRVEIVEAMRKVLIEISDDGSEIPPGEEEKMFQLYYSYQQIDGLAPSLGLGLSVARRIARAMGGDLRYDRFDGRNVFELSVPRAESAAAPARRVPVRTVDPLEGKPTRDAIQAVIDGGGPRMVYQPIIDIRSGRERVVGFEALARFETGGPPEWFHAAGSLGIRLELEVACIKAAIDGFQIGDDSFLAVNLADRTLHSSRLIELVDSFDAARLVLELSESAAIKSYEETRAIVESLAERGVRLAVDDIGAGEVDLWHMSRTGAQIIKIDLSLIQRIVTHPRDRGLVKGIVAMAGEIGAVVIAEGVETEEQHRLLVDLGADLGQGFLYGKPDALHAPTGPETADEGYRWIAG
jgi:EAL domain-containing protein (putative c-di-GMP-specific phosphodiesterase class I)/signal transduction histidine kinase